MQQTQELPEVFAWTYTKKISDQIYYLTAHAYNCGLYGVYVYYLGHSLRFGSLSRIGKPTTPRLVSPSPVFISPLARVVVGLVYVVLIGVQDICKFCDSNKNHEVAVVGAVPSG